VAATTILHQISLGFVLVFLIYWLVTTHHACCVEHVQIDRSMDRSDRDDLDG
jgi:uncharacterized membrane protein